MKNIHVLATDKPSRLCKNEFGKFYLTELMESKISFFKNQNIYITSEEEIKEGDWYYDLDLNKLHQFIHSIGVNFNTLKKIILTTDQDLIKDGVQAIDDEFLEWFFKNPSCEFVIVELPKSRDNYISNEQYQKEHMWDTNVKIIIPSKEEPKHRGKELTTEEVMESRSSAYEFIDFDKQETLEEDYSGVHFRHCYQGEYEDGCKYGEDNCPAKPLEEPKQETLEEAAEYHIKMQYPMGVEKEYPINDFIQGAKWQQERSYSEEEVLKLLKDYNEHTLKLQALKLGNSFNVEDWFEQCKKK